jgi:hypothetical protein
MPIVSTSYKPGQSGNPNGRPKEDWTMSGLIREALEEQDENGIPYKKLIANKLAKLAAKGELMAVKETINRIDGMPKQFIENTGDMNLNIKIVDDKGTD